MASHDIDFKIMGEEMQAVEIELDPQETVIAEAGSLLSMSPDIQMNTIFGSGAEETFLDKAWGAGKRVLTGESLFMATYTHAGTGKAHVTFAAPYPGKIVPLKLSEHNGKMICQKDAFLCAAHGVSVGIEFQKKIGAGLFGGEGFIMQKLEGDGLAFVHAGGYIIEKSLAQGETLRVDTGCIVAFESSINYDIEYIGSIKTAVFGGEGLFLATLTGPGKIWIQSLPFSRIASRILSLTARKTDTGSLLGGLGNIAMGE